MKTISSPPVAQTSTADPFPVDPAQSGFEALAQTDGFKFWWASDLARLLGYRTLDAFRKAVNKAMIASDALGIPLVDNFLQDRRRAAGRMEVDFRAWEELAANLFRITQTEAKIRKKQPRGQPALEDAAEEVGRRVRRTMEEISGNRPEELPPSEDIKVVRRQLKSAQRGFKKLDQAGSEK